MFYINDIIMMIILFQFRFEHIIDQVERVHGLKKVIVFPLVQLPDISFGGIKKDSLLKFLRPYHLHLNKELAPSLILTSHVNNAVFLQGIVGNELRRNVFYTLNSIIVIKGKESI